MRWNPRRRQVTSVIYVQAGKTADEKPKSPWNSLEASKLVVGSLTPLVIGLIGVYYAHEGQVAQAERAQQEQLRTRKAEAEPLIREQQSVVARIIKALDDAEKSVEARPADRSKLLAELDGTLKPLSEANFSASTKLHYVINDPFVASDMAREVLQDDLDIASARECIENKGVAGRPQCSVKPITSKLWRCSVAKTFALSSFEHLPVEMKGLETKDCHFPSLVKVDDPESIRKAMQMADALGAFLASYKASEAAAASAASAASH